MRKLQPSDVKELKIELEKDGKNLFFSNNLDIYTLSKEIDVYQVAGAFVLNWMNASILIYAPNGYDCNEMLSFLRTQRFNGINGPKEYLEPLEPLLEERFNIQYRNLLRVDKSSFNKISPRDERLVELFSPDDYEDLFCLYQRIPEYKDSFNDDEKEEWAMGKAQLEYPMAGVGLYAEEKMVSGAYLSAATKKSAMIVGVGTDPDFQDQGLATKVTSELVDIALNENNIGYVCLWYSDDKAKHIYSKLGFKPVCEYAYFSRKERI